MYILYRSYVGRVPENLKRDAHPRRHLLKTEQEDYNGLKRGTHDSTQTPNALAQSKFDILLLCARTCKEEDGFDMDLQKKLLPSTMISACQTPTCPLQYFNFCWRGCVRPLWWCCHHTTYNNQPIHPSSLSFFTFQRQPIHLSTLCTIHHQPWLVH